MSQTLVKQRTDALQDGAGGALRPVAGRSSVRWTPEVGFIGPSPQSAEGRGAHCKIQRNWRIWVLFGAMMRLGRKTLMSSDQSFDDLMARLRAGDEDAAAEIHSRFVEPLCKQVQRRLYGSIRQKVDDEDIVQSVFKTFFRRNGAGEFELEDWDSLRKLLFTITFRKCCRKLESYHADCRDISNEVPSLPHEDVDKGTFNRIKRMPRELGPPDNAILDEFFEEMLRILGPQKGRIILLHLDGLDIPAISSQIGRSERSVYRAIEDAQEWLRGRMEDEGREGP
jgi:RNA polymerase sigma-70 factor (ECF subfamily)